MVPTVALMVIAAVLITGCVRTSRTPTDPAAAPFRDRCFLEDDSYILVEKLYAEKGTLHLVERHLKERLQWLPCEVNEALYRLRKVHDLPN